MSALVLIVLSAVSLVAALVLVAGVAGVVTGRMPWLPRAGRAASAAVAAVAATVLLANVWAGWGGPFGGTGLRAKPMPDVRRADLGEGRLARLVEAAARPLPPSNRGLRQRLAPAPDPREITAPALWLAANDAPSPEALRRGILGDAWRVYQAVFQDPAFAQVLHLRLVVTHPGGRRLHPDLEPTVAIIDLDRDGFRRINPLRDPATQLERLARIRWLPPLDGTGAR